MRTCAKCELELRDSERITKCGMVGCPELGSGPHAPPVVYDPKRGYLVDSKTGERAEQSAARSVDEGYPGIAHDLETASSILRMLVDAASADKLEDFTKTSNVADMAADFLRGKTPSSAVAEFDEFIGRLSDMAHSPDFWSDKPYGNRLYYGQGAGDYIAADILHAFLHALKVVTQKPGALATARADTLGSGLTGRRDALPIASTVAAPLPPLDATIKAAEGMANTGASAMHVIELFRALASESGLRPSQRSTVSAPDPLTIAGLIASERKASTPPSTVAATDDTGLDSLNSLLDAAMGTPRTDAFRRKVGGEYPNERTEHQQIMDLIGFAEQLERELQTALGTRSSIAATGDDNLPDDAELERQAVRMREALEQDRIEARTRAGNTPTTPQGSAETSGKPGTEARQLDAVAQALGYPVESWRMAGCYVLAHAVSDLIANYTKLQQEAHELREDRDFTDRNWGSMIQRAERAEEALAKVDATLDQVGAPKDGSFGGLLCALSRRGRIKRLVAPATPSPTEKP